MATQGSYSDEATGTAVSLENSELRSFVVLDKSEKVAAISALTTIAAQHVGAYAAEGIGSAVTSANQEVAEAFGLAGVNLAVDIPANLSQAAHNGLLILLNQEKFSPTHLPHLFNLVWYE